MISVELLKNASIFKNLDGDTLKEIASIGYEEIYQSEETIFEEGDKAEDIYVVIKGRVFIHTGFDVKLGSVVVDTVGEGDIFGWSALTRDRSFTASAKAADKTWLVFINGEKIRS